MRILIAAVLMNAGAALACDGLVVERGWVRPPMPGMSMTAGYAALSNQGKNALIVEHVSSSGFDEVELHRSAVENGISRMRPALPLPLAPGAVQLLEPGGYHLMLFDPAQPLKTGQSVVLEFRCGTQAMQAPFTVQSESP